MSKSFLTIAIIIFIVGLGFYLFKRLGDDNREDNVIKPFQVNQTESEFLGEKGEKIELVNGQIELNVVELDNDAANYHNVKISNGKTVYFFVVKDQDGIYHAAANACQVCFADHLGFYKEGNNMVCKACGNEYPMEKIATEKGGCNPGPINPNLEVIDGKILINESELEQVSGLF